MKKALLLLCIFCIAVVSYSQKVYFIYLQSESGTPFFVKMAGKIYSSTASGYVILPKLVDSTYMLTVGLPGNTSKEATFSVAINSNDKGLMVQNAGNSLKLYDWQTATIYQPVADNTTPTTAVSTNADSFTKLLSAAADDASLLTAPIAVKQEVARQNKKQTETAKPAVTVATEKPKADSDIANNTVAVNTPPPPAVDTTAIAATPAAPSETKTAITDSNTTAAKASDQNSNTAANNTIAANNNPIINSSTTNPTANTTANTNTVSENSIATPAANTATTTAPQPSNDNQLPFRRSAIMRKSESSTTEGFGLTYIDNTPQGVDTIRLLIPNPKVQFYTGATDEHHIAAEKKSEKNDSPLSVSSPAIITPAAKMPRASCKSTATENDFYKLRKNMAGVISDEAMINEAKKAFRKKCYTTEQIKNLSALFLTPAAKYQFFDAAYMHVSDQEQFKNLQSEIKDDYYANRFKALIGNL